MRIPKEQWKKDNPEKLATLGTQDEEKKEKHDTICAGYHYRTKVISFKPLAVLTDERRHRPIM